MASLVTDLAVALRDARASTPSAAANPVEPGVLTFGRDGRLRTATATARALLDALPIDARHEGPPHAIVTLAAAANARRVSVLAMLGA